MHIFFSIKHVPKDDFPLPNIDLLVDKTIVKVCLLLFSDDSKFSSSASSPCRSSFLFSPLTSFELNYIHPRGRVRFVIGAPLGLYGAWPAFALTHHLVIWFVAAQVYQGVPFTRYAILGDDIVIGDKRVAERYHELIPPLNVPFSLEKSLVSSVGALEFAKWFFVRGVTKDFFPISCHMLRSLVSSISLVPVMRAIMSKNLPLSYRLREAGYWVYTRRTVPPRRHWNRHFLVFHSLNVFSRKIESTNKALNWRTISEYRNAENEEGQFALEQSWSADRKMELDSAKSSVLEDEILETIPSLVTEEDNKMLTSPPNMEEVQKEGALGPPTTRHFQELSKAFRMKFTWSIRGGNSGIFTSHQEDRGIWKKNRSESFILKAGWESIRNRTGIQAWTQFVWDKAIPTIISIFAWKLLFDFVCGDFRIIWELWKEGNSSKLENPISQPVAIIQKITDWLKDCSQLLDIRSSWTFTDSILLDALYIHQARKLAIDSKIIVDCFNENKEAPKVTHT
ncbi:hypothetical protein MTR67_039923 [Solanum verrucosum]|uniref:Reverse transcriptase zinc-binding domain-containing protein n=1 Tax=Solanum verrucosum TaxID=315347 RepID=A0AAF0UHQ5_SOLVR|nr:hypothetical protein MTR67_039923 [Solanum verrucosum]